MRYAPDPKLEIDVRLYQRPDVIVPDFEAVAQKVHEFVRCELDVTHLSATHSPLVGNDPPDCRPIAYLGG